MRNYMPKVGTLGLDMMFRTCTVQVSIFFFLFMYGVLFSQRKTYYCSLFEIISKRLETVSDISCFTRELN
jgi:hypothetical protein